MDGMIGLGLITICGLVGVCWFEGIGVICDGPPKTDNPDEPEPRMMSLDQAMKELKEERKLCAGDSFPDGVPANPDLRGVV